MARKKTGKVFDTDRRIRLGVWGLGRGLNFYASCAQLNIDVVAGCDFNAHMRDHFQEMNPDAFVTDDAEAFLNHDFDAVLLATFCPNHTADAIRCLDAGKHVLSEVTAFHTMAEGVALVEAVRQSELVYNLAENYPFTPAQQYVARRWREGLFGDLMYAEGEYVHEVRSLAYTYIDGVPVEPGYALHNWRSWLSFHYYCTHSLGPIMHATGTRPVRVVSLPGSQSLAGYTPSKSGSLGGLGGAAPSLITTDNGALVKNLMGGTTNDTHLFRYWGTRGSAEIGDGLRLRLGAGGSTPKLEVHPTRDPLAKLAEATGHGGGDFFVLYYFARQILFGEPAPFEIHAAADVTIPGILAYRSAMENGQPYDVPDFRKKKDRDAWRDDHYAQPRPDVTVGLFPKRADKAVTRDFNRVVSRLVYLMQDYRAYQDWQTVAEDLPDPAQAAALAGRLIEVHPEMLETIAAAEKLCDAYPRSKAARVLGELLDLTDVPAVRAAGFVDEVKRVRRRLGRKTAR